MFESFTDSAIHVLMTAQKQARKLGHDRLGTREILIALSKEPSGLVGHIMESAGFSIDRCLVEIQSGRSINSDATSGRRGLKLACIMDLFTPMPFSSDSLRLMDAAIALSRKANSKSVLPEHILLALSELHDCRGAQLLSKSGVQIHTLRNKISAMSAS